jgi:ribose transport system substrate-binding protein
MTERLRTPTKLWNEQKRQFNEMTSPNEGFHRRKDTMGFDHDDHEDSVSRRRAIKRMIWTSTGVLWMVSGGSKSFSQVSAAQAATAIGQAKPTIPIIVKDKTSPYWRTVLAGARQAGRDLGVNVIELGTDSETDINGQIDILAQAVAPIPAAIVIAPAQFAALGKPVDKAAKQVKIIGIDSDADSSAFTSFVKTDNVQAGRLAADILADAIKRTYADAEGDVAIITSLFGVASLDQRARGFKEQIATKYGALDIVAHKVGDGQATTGFNIMMDLIADYPELRGVFASDLVMAKGAARAVAEQRTNKGGDTINFVGFGADKSLVQLLRDGTVVALVVQDPFRMGYDGIKTALAASRGEHVPTNVDTDANLITKADMNSARSQELLNPKVN